jgi:uncharacterized phage-associated protein
LSDLYANTIGDFCRGETIMCSVLDVAAYILKKQGRMTHLKLQKLVYYSQAWSLVWDEKPLFSEPIEAWANGPVAPKLFERLRQKFNVDEKILGCGNPEKISVKGRATIDSVLEYYGKRSSQYLSDLTHMEDPWRNAREGLAPGERGSREITYAAMAEYYSSL